MTKEEIKTLLYNIFSINFVYKHVAYDKAYKSLKPEITVYYHIDSNNLSYLNIHIQDINQFANIQQKLNQSNLGYISFISQASIQFFLYDNLKNIDI